MIEIMVAVWTISFVLSLSITAFNFYVVNRQLRSSKLNRLNRNLAHVSLYWSNTAGDFRALESGAIEADAQNTRRSSLMLGLLGFLSLPGFILLAIIVASLRILARSRKERAVFNSPLVSSEKMEVSEISKLVETLRMLQ